MKKRKLIAFGKNNKTFVYYTTETGMGTEMFLWLALVQKPFRQPDGQRFCQRATQLKRVSTGTPEFKNKP